MVEQDDQDIFNKDQMMNTAFQYIVNHTDFDCVIFHDVDLFSENDRLIYKCPGNFFQIYVLKTIWKVYYIAIISILTGK